MFTVSLTCFLYDLITSLSRLWHDNIQSLTEISLDLFMLDENILLKCGYNPTLYDYQYFSITCLTLYLQHHLRQINFTSLLSCASPRLALTSVSNILVWLTSFHGVITHLPLPSSPPLSSPPSPAPSLWSSSCVGALGVGTGGAGGEETGGTLCGEKYLWTGKGKREGKLGGGGGGCVSKWWHDNYLYIFCKDNVVWVRCMATL